MPQSPSYLLPCMRPNPFIQGVTAFLKRQTHEAAFGEGSSLVPGMLLEVAVVTPGGATSGARTVTVSTDPNLVRGSPHMMMPM